jgi:hypothetical protein
MHIPEGGEQIYQRGSIVDYLSLLRLGTAKRHLSMGTHP